MMNAPEELLSSAMEAHRKGNLSDAETKYRHYLIEYPKDANVLHNLGVIGLQTGHGEAALELFHKAVAVDPNFADAYCNMGLTLKQLGRADEAINAYRQAIELAPDMAEAHSNLGVLQNQTGQLDDAAKAFQQAINIDPAYADALSNLGNIRRKQGKLAEAIEYFSRAHQVMPDQSIILMNLGAALVEIGKPEAGKEMLYQAVGLSPDHSAAHYNLGKAHFALGNMGGAIESYRRAIDLDPDFADAQHNLAHALLINGQLEEGWRAYDWRWKAKKFDSPPRSFPQPLWDGSSLAGKKVLIWSEQGIGDKILFSGLLPEISSQAKTCVLETESRLAPLFARSFPDIEVVVRQEPVDRRIKEGEFDVQLPLGDLPKWLRPDLEKFKPLGSYLTVDQQKSNDCRRRYDEWGSGPKIGISWASQPPKGIPLADFAPLLGLPGVTWINLQYGDHEDEIETTEKSLGVKIYTDGNINPLEDIDGFAAQISALDAVVTIQNTTLYMAAGLGVPTYGVTSPIPDWRWFGQDHSPWHENITLFRRDLEADDRAMIDRLAEIIANSIC